MSLELFPPDAARALPPGESQRIAMGAYEALMAQGQSLPRLAAALRRHPGLQLAQLASDSDVSTYAAKARQAMSAAALGEVCVVTHDAPDWPPGLRDAADVALLYYLGCWDLIGTRCVALVGTRRPSAAGLARAAQWAAQLAAEGFTVVSGLARGIDTCAHQAALAAGGHTIAVLGTPLSATYPPENRALQRRIADQQLLISHVPFVQHAQQSAHANREFFLQRNAVIPALSEATLVIEAGETSGALVAARHALRQGRRLMIAAGCADESLLWPDRLLAQGAVRVKDYADIRAQLAAAVA